ncbi:MULTISPECIES: hypothetical protein [Rhizobium]|uniref:Uncharacterized protein n=1 Tax=Rhizobium aouanii TaxID=3118145 RepID=A0ABU8CV58_9HYPH|nr:hypothetical protein [Rhizobium acaciae]MCW1754167.1 hypothetical protein [Rhizobium acaciae]
MADLQKIASTSSIDLQPVGPLSERDHARLVDCLSQAIGADAASLLAEPVTNRDGSQSDWYSRRRGAAQPLSALDETQAEALRTKLGEIEQQIEGLAARLSASPHPDDRSMASALQNALIVPGEGFIYAVDGWPVLTAWGFTHARKPGYRGGLSKIAPLKPERPSLGSPARYVEPAAQAEPVAVAQQGQVIERLRSARGCLPLLLWLLFALLVAIILFVLLRACAFGISIPFLDIGTCRAGATVSTIGDLQREIVALEGQLIGRRDDCQTRGLAFAGPGAARSGQSLESTIDDRLAERNAGKGSLQISLVWDGYADLDLSLICGAGSIDYRSPRGCGGILDVDSNNGRTATARPVENITWADQQGVPAGDVPIAITLFNRRNETRTAIPYTVRIRRKDGDTVLSERVIEGVADANQLGRPAVVGKLNP